MEAQRAQAELTDAYAELGAIAEPIMTTLKFMAADVLQAMLPFVALMGEGLQGVLEGTAGSAETFAQGLSGLVEVLLEKVSAIVPAIGQAVLASLPALLDAGVDIICLLYTSGAISGNEEIPDQRDCPHFPGASPHGRGFGEIQLFQHRAAELGICQIYPRTVAYALGTE